MIKKKITLKYVDMDSTVKKQEDGPFFDLLSDHYEIEFSDNPEYLIYGPFGEEHLNYEKSLRIFYTGECISPDFNICDYAIGFDDISFGDRYFRYPLWLKYGKEHNDRMEKKHLEISKEMLNRDFCAFVVSNDFADPMRDILFKEISKYKKVNSGGKYLNNIGEPNGVSSKMDFQQRHKFVLACENCSHAGYTTEKLMEAFEAHTVPIYWGDPDIENTFNPKSFINCMKYDSIDDLIKDIKEIDSNDKKYISMLKEPAILSEDRKMEKCNSELVSFLVHIFDQPYLESFRTNRQCWGKKYYSHRQEQKRLFDWYKGLNGLFRHMISL